jgi:hypothetical protein
LYLLEQGNVISLSGHYIEGLTLMIGNCSFCFPIQSKGQLMSDHPHIVVPRADRYGHPERVKLTAPALTSDEHGAAAPHCDKYGHVEGNERRVKFAAEGRSAFVLR